MNQETGTTSSSLIWQPPEEDPIRWWASYEEKIPPGGERFRVIFQIKPDEIPSFIKIFQRNNTEGVPTLQFYAARGKNWKEILGG